MHATFAGRRLCAAAAMALLLAGAPGATRADAEPTIVQTDTGAIRGSLFEQHRIFYGVPYAAPPVGALRFAPPQRHAPWSNVRSALLPGWSCPQPPDPALHLYGSTHEDCLYLNVFAPWPVPASGLPMMIWFHGGGFVTGSGADYMAGQMAEAGQVIVVTVNYRLGPFGFLAHPALTAESSAASGNYGLMDQQAAVQWVRRNAAAFGGDPNRITIFGESAGGMSVCAQLASPAMAGQFQRAIIQSGPCNAPITLPQSQAEATGEKVATDNGCPATADAAAAACLRALPVQALLAAEGSVGVTSAVPFFPVHGGPLLPEPPGQAIADGHFNHVPVIQGTNHDEARLIAAISYDLQGAPLDAAGYEQAMRDDFGANADAVLAQYPVAAYDAPDLAYAAVVTDSFFACPALATDQALVAQGVPVYAYEFDDTTAPSLIDLSQVSIPLGAYHGAEVGYLFFNPLQLLDAKQGALSDRMIGYWTHFANKAYPSLFGATYWPRFNAGGSILSLVPRDNHVIDSFAADHQCAFWNALPPIELGRSALTR